jgi:hypothetical protein
MNKKILICYLFLMALTLSHVNATTDSVNSTEEIEAQVTVETETVDSDKQAESSELVNVEVKPPSLEERKQMIIDRIEYLKSIPESKRTKEDNMSLEGLPIILENFDKIIEQQEQQQNQEDKK